MTHLNLKSIILTPLNLLFSAIQYPQALDKEQLFLMQHLSSSPAIPVSRYPLGFPAFLPVCHITDTCSQHSTCELL